MVLAMPGFSVKEAPRSRRVSRRPAHTFAVTARPFGIYPFMLAPVLPGETMKNLLLQSRAVTDPVLGRLTGWWLEYYFFYVKLRDLPSTLAAAVETMILDPSQNLDAVAGSADTPEHYFTPGGANAINWAAACLQSVTEAYFREESEAWDTRKIANVPMAKFNDKTWLDSYMSDAEMPTADTLVGAEAFGDFERRWQNWVLLRQQGMTELTWEDYLATFGVNVSGPGKNKPELIRFIREWQYPSNTIDPSDGSAVSAVSWSISERADKDRYFTEPGFIFGVTVTRTKTYRWAQKSTASVMLDTPLAWMPALLKDDPSSSIRELAQDAGNNPLSSSVVAGAVHVDVRDLYLYGDQWVYNANCLSADTCGDIHNIDHETGNARHLLQYPLVADVDDLFADRDPATKIYNRMDGIVQLNILGTQVDYT